MSDSYECLSFTDAFFMYLEQPGSPLNVASVSAFEGTITLDECSRYIESKLPSIPRFLQRVVPSPFGIGAPTWQYDPQFDVRNHVREVTLKRGTEAEWKAAVSEVLSHNFDRSRPLWDITLFHGLRSERTGLAVRAHHCLVDGVAGVGLLKALLNESAVSPPLPRRRKRRVAVPPKHELGTELLDGLIRSCFSTAQALLTAHSELLRMAQQASACANSQAGSKPGTQIPAGPLGRVAPLGDLARLLSELAQPVEKLPFNVLCRGPQKFDWVEIPMAEIESVRHACDATVNDVVLTTLILALRSYAELHKPDEKRRGLRIVIPVNVRAESEAPGTGNQITFLPVDIPTSTRDPRKLLSLIQKRVAFSRTAYAAELVALAGLLMEAIPTALQSLAGAVLSQLPISVCNSICTNVHGPATPLYLLGHKLLSTYPYVPIGGEMGMNCAVLSYNGSLFVGFTGDAQAVPDLSRLAAMFAASFAELRTAVGVQASRRKHSRVKRVLSKAGEEPAPVTASTTVTAAAAAVA
jgi:diacylglycerol O-acyltransferase